MTHLLGDISAVITAGGQSKRFGTDKALALWHGQSLLQHVASGLCGFAERVLIAPPNRYNLPNWTPALDGRPGEGPLAGLETALLAAHYNWIAFTGVDAPTLDAEYWQALAAARTKNNLSVQAADPLGQPQPLGALYHRDLLPSITKLLNNGERRLRLACPVEQTGVVYGLSRHYFQNINRPADLEALALSGS